MMRVCSEPGCPEIQQATRCPKHRRAIEKARGSRQQRGYDRNHIRLRRHYVRQLRAGIVLKCWRCGGPITDEADMHVGHDDKDRSIIRGPEHARSCNLHAAGRAAHGLPPRPPGG